MFLGRLANPQSRRNVSKIRWMLIGEWKALSGSAKLALISPNTEELFLRAAEAYAELQDWPRKKTLPHNGLAKGPLV